MARLRRDSRREIPYERRGTLEVALDDTDAERLSGMAQTLSTDGVEARWLPPSTLFDLEPQVAPSAAGGLLIPMHGFVGVSALTAAAVATAEERGAVLMNETGALRVGPAPGGGVRVRASSTTIEADACVMAAGSWSSRVAIEGADAVPVTPVRGQLLQLTSQRGLLTRVIWGSAGYLVPWPDGSVLAGATVEDVGFDEGTTQEGRHALLDMAVGLVPGLRDAGIADARAGLRPRGPDDLPLIGRSTIVPGLVYATGHYRNGVLLAPFTARLVCQLVLDPAAAAPPSLDPRRCGAL
ncbi:MAG: FAD-dependent oxidoreductase [Vicinamibacterales bacterium]